MTHRKGRQPPKVKTRHHGCRVAGSVVQALRTAKGGKSFRAQDTLDCIGFRPFSVSCLLTLRAYFHQMNELLDHSMTPKTLRPLSSFFVHVGFRHIPISSSEWCLIAVASDETHSGLR